MTDHGKDSIAAIYSRVAREYADLPGNAATIVEETVKQTTHGRVPAKVVDAWRKATAS